MLRILHVAGVAIDWDRQEAGIIAFERHKTALPVELLDSVKRTRVALKGPVTTPIGEGFTSVNVGLAQGVGPVRQPAARVVAARRAHALLKTST